MAVNGTPVKLENIIKGLDEQNKHSWNLTHRGDPIAPDPALFVASTTCQPLVEWSYGSANGPKDAQGNLIPKKTWYCLLVSNISFNLPVGFRDGDVGTSIRKGKFEVWMTAETQGLGHETNDKAVDGNWDVLTIDHGPKNTSTSQSVSNSVSTDVGANVGFFGTTPTAGLNVGTSLSHSVSKVITDVNIQTNQFDSRHTQYWNFDFSQLNDSQESKSDFSYTVQAIWQYQYSKDEDMVLDKIPYKMKVKWVPVLIEQFGRSATMDPQDAEAQEFEWPIEWHGDDIPQSKTNTQK